MKQLSLAVLGSIALLGCDQTNPTLNDRPMKDGTTPVVERDNSAVNKRDSNTDTKTAFDQNENKVDIGITASIRKSVVDTKMSINAQNVKIITQDGNVTLRGPVKTQEEKERIDEIARKVAGVNAVDNQLEVEKNP
jgi:hyperosmotically inducible periplasmic protein